MSDNVKDQIAEATMYQIHGLDVDTILEFLAERGMVVLGPDGEPLDVRPALRVLGSSAAAECRDIYRSMDATATPLPEYVVCGAIGLLIRDGMPTDLADACLAAAEVEG